jgi:transposase
VAQTARALHLHPRTITKWSARSHFEPRRPQSRGSVLDPFKPHITRLLDTYPYSAQQIFQRLREVRYGGGMTILRDYVRRIGPQAAGLSEAPLCCRRVMRSLSAEFLHRRLSALTASDW